MNPPAPNSKSVRLYRLLQASIEKRSYQLAQADEVATASEVTISDLTPQEEN